MVTVTNFGKDMTDKLRKRMQKRVFRVYFVPEKYVFRVCFKSPFTRMISSLKYKCPPLKIMIRNIECKNIIERSEEGSKEGRRKSRGALT